MLYFHWFLLIFVLIVLVEAVVYYKYWKQLLVAVKVSFVGNMASTLIALPFYLETTQLFSWVDLIVLAENIVTHPNTLLSEFGKFIFILFTFFITFLVTLSIEVVFMRMLKERQTNDAKVIMIANLVTYLSILLLLILLGGLYGLLNQNPTIDAETFYGSWLFVELDDFLIHSGLFGFFMYLGMIMTVFIVLIAFLSEMYDRLKPKLSTD